MHLCGWTTSGCTGMRRTRSIFCYQVDCREAFAIVMNDPMEKVKNRFKELTLHGNSVEVHDWPGGGVGKEELDIALKKNDPSFNCNIRLWSQLKTKMPLMSEFIEGH